MFKFRYLKHQNPEIDGQLIYDQSEQLLNLQNNRDFEIPVQLDSVLEDNVAYYVLHERMLHKGKVTKYIGHAVLSWKPEIIGFINDSIVRDDLRPMRIFKTQDSKMMIRIDDEGTFCLYME